MAFTQNKTANSRLILSITPLPNLDSALNKCILSIILESKKLTKFVENIPLE